MDLNGIINKLAQARLKIRRTVIVIDLVVHVPITFNLDTPVFNHQQMTRRKLLHALKKRARVDRVLESQVFGKPFGIGFDRWQKRHQRFDLRGKIKLVANGRVVKRLNPEPITRAE